MLAILLVQVQFVTYWDGAGWPTSPKGGYSAPLGLYDKVAYGDINNLDPNHNSRLWNFICARLVV